MAIGVNIPERESVYKSENYTIYSRLFSGDRPLFVSFMFRVDNGQAFGENTFIKYGLNAVHVVTRGPHWYQYEDTPLAIGAVARLAATFPRVITYGTSMGGYAALLFSKRLNADVVLAFSPQYSLNPDKVPFEKRWLNDVREIRRGAGFIFDDMDGEITQSGRIFIGFDPLSADKKHVDLLENLRPICAIVVPFSRHRTIRVLSEMRLSSAILLQAAADDLDRNAFRVSIRERRAASTTYLNYVARELERRGRRGSLELARRAADATKVDDYETLEGNFSLLRRQGARREAAQQLLLLLNSKEYLARPQAISTLCENLGLIEDGDALGRAIDVLSRQKEAHRNTRLELTIAVMLAMLAKAANDFDGAFGHIFSAVAADRLPEIAFDLARFLDQCSQTEIAIQLARIALRHHPMQIEILRFLADRLERIGKYRDAADVYRDYDQLHTLPDGQCQQHYARLLERLRDWPMAILQWEKIRHLKPDSAGGYDGGAKALMSVGRIAEAENLLLEGQIRLPHDYNLKITLGWVANRQGNWPTAHARWKALYSDLPDNKQVNLGLMESCCALGQWNEATALAARLRALGIDDTHLKALEDRINAAANSVG